MGRATTAWLRIKSLWRRRQMDCDLEDELRFHLEMKADANRAAGIDAEESSHAARRAFGNLAGVREACRELWTLGQAEIWCKDLRYALRVLGKNPAFTTVAVITLSLAIGANTAIFSVVNAVMLRSLPYKDSDSLAILWTRAPRDHANELRTSIPNFGDWKTQSRTFEDMAFYEDHNHGTVVDLHSGGTQPEMIWYAWVSTNFFQVLGVAPELGRTFTEQEVARGERVAVLDHQLWQRRFGGSPGVWVKS
jgi:MacB-like periplasmic core domain